ncbi:MAG: OB-fold nucleic acid binding domain-containing protein [Pirellulaceae bacterium]
MSRRFINQLGERENVDEIYLVSEKQLRANRAGNLYLQVRLSDRTGSLTAMLWNANEQLSKTFENGNFVRVQGTTQFYNGTLQMIAQRIEAADASTIDEADFITLGEVQIDRMAQRLSEMLRGVSNVHLRNLAECFLVDEAFMDKFTRAPAGVKNHHAYQGGLLEHVVGLMELVQSVAPHYPDLDGEQLLFGAFLHDMGKIDELTYERDLGYSDEGQLIGHLVLAVGMLEAKIREAEKLSGETFPSDLALRLKHMIVSHHGEYAFGSPKLPMTLEAIALAFLDNLDAKLHSIGHLMREDANAESRWTPYQPSLERKFFKPPSEAADGENSAG